MPWNQNQSNNPWGNRPPGGGGNQTPPDIDEVIKRLQERFGGLFGGGKGGNGGGDLSKGLLGAVAAIVLLLWLATGIYMVAADEEAIVLRFGQHTATKGPGLNWHFPYPIETVEKLPVTTVQRLGIGFRDFGEGRVRKVPQESLMLTSDENIVDISFIVQYKIKSVENYLF
ncbi:MAG TPA: protease modulator HflK, partial [Mariprofundaceae bacterium]|nr:protease modulator HflK [Mariprofundaceae bacterium]